MKINVEHTTAVNYTESTVKNGNASILFGRKAVTDQKKEMFFSEFHSLLSSGVDFNRAFELLAGGEKEGNYKKLLGELHGDVISGRNLWQSLSDSGYFSNLDSGVIRIGEETGKLYESLHFLSEYYHNKAAQRRMISSAVSYPIIILAIAVIVLVFMILVVVPMFEQVYSRMGGELPGVTKTVIDFSRNFKYYLTGLSILAGSTAVVMVLYRRTETLQRIKSSLLMKIPFAGSLVKKHYQSHFCKLMYLLYSSGVPLLQGLQMLAGIITFYPYRKSFGSIAEGLNRGESFAANIARYPDIYDRKLTVLIKVGEEANRLSDMLKKQGDDLATELEYKLKQMGSMLEPMLIILVGVLVAIVLISMYLPMFKLGTTIY